MLYYNYINSPCGEIELCASNVGLVSVLFTQTQKRILVKQEITTHPFLSETAKQLKSYFNKQLQAFDLPFDLVGTDFQKRVWNELTQINFGKTISYLELSKRLGDEKCIRAAASANGKNPISIIVPCHRVIGSNGKLTGYSGNLDRKEYLLNLEGSCIHLFS